MSLSLEITGLYAGLLALLLIGLSVNVIRMRFKHRVGIGDGQIKEVSQAIRMHGNFIEYVPIALVLLASYELSGGSNIWLHVFGGGLFFARVSHAIGINKSIGTSLPRALGVIVTFIVIAGLSILNILSFV